MAKYQVIIVSVDRIRNYNSTYIREVEAKDDVDALKAAILKDAHDLYFGSYPSKSIPTSGKTAEDWQKFHEYSKEVIDGWEQTKEHILEQCVVVCGGNNGDFVTKSIFIEDGEDSADYIVKADSENK